MSNIIICDDEKDIVSALKIQLSGEGHNIIEAYNGQEVLDIIKERKDEINLLLMDVMMPVMDGMTALVKLREFSSVPVILLTAKDSDNDKVLGLNIGADDYITKPYNPLELIARVKARLRPHAQVISAPISPDTLINGGIKLIDHKKIVFVDGEEVNFTPTEYAILKFFMEHIGEVFSPKEIYKRVWVNDPLSADNTVTVHIRHLREKIEINPSEPRYLKVVWGHGYRMEDVSLQNDV